MIRAYTGKTGSGKTYLMVKDAYHEWLRGTDIYSNTILKFDPKISHKDWFTPWERIKKIFSRNKPKRGRINYFQNIEEILDINNGLVLFDEAQVLFNARMWESLPEEFQYKLQQHRKHKIDLICTTQNMGTIDITYRRLVHSWIHCRNVFQIGSSPKILFGVFLKQEKDVDQLYNSVDDLMVETVSSKAHFIHFFSKALYDTMFDIGFRRYKTIWLNEYKNKTRTQTLMILPKKMSLSQALTHMRLSSSLLSMNKPKTTWRN